MQLLMEWRLKYEVPVQRCVGRVDGGAPFDLTQGDTLRSLVADDEYLRRAIALLKVREQIIKRLEAIDPAAVAEMPPFTTALMHKAFADDVYELMAHIESRLICDGRQGVVGRPLEHDNL